MTKQPQGHDGVDYATYGKCPPILCPFDGGEVLRIGTDRFGAKFVYVGFKALNRVGLAYHCSKINCHVGQKLSKGDTFAFVGTTGRSTGEHLHWGWMLYNDKWNKYYDADYEDFEKYELPEEEEKVEVAKIKASMNGKTTELSSIVYNSENYLRIRDLADAQKDDKLEVIS